MSFRYKKGIQVGYNEQGWIYFHCLKYKSLPKKEQEKILRKLRKAVESIESELAEIEEKIAAYDKKFATATEYNEADYAAYNDLKAQYDKQMHEWEKASYELEITENQ
mgnify:CR=1 FL=1